jgi:hypothetical protein
VQLQAEIASFLQGLSSSSGSGSDDGGRAAAELPLVEHAAGFERYKVIEEAVRRAPWCT